MFTAFVTKSLFPGTIKAVTIKHSLQVLYSYEISLKLVRSNVYQYHQKQQHSTHKNWTQTLNTGKSHSLPKHKMNRQNPCHQHVMVHKYGKDFLFDLPAVSDHPWLLSDTTIWSLSRQTVCAIGQFSGIPTPLVGHATIQNSTNNLTNKL